MSGYNAMMQRPGRAVCDRSGPLFALPSFLPSFLNSPSSALAVSGFRPLTDSDSNDNAPGFKPRAVLLFSRTALFPHRETGPFSVFHRHTIHKANHMNLPLMKRSVLCLFAVFCLGFGLFLPTHPALAEDIVWPGSWPLRQPDPGNGGPVGSLLPNALSGNSVTVNGGIVPGSVIGSDYQPVVGSNVTGNIVVVNGGTVGRDVIGAWTSNDNATGNIAVINGGVVNGNVYGGAIGAIYSAAPAGSGNATGNSVFINGGTVGGNVYGGYSLGNVLYSASGNSVTISGGTVGGDIYGGYHNFNNGVLGGTATNNTVTLYGAPNLSASTIYGGGYLAGAGVGDAFTGNTLNVHGFTGPVVGLYNFQNYNLTPSPVFVPGMTQVQITGGVPVNLAGTNVTFNGGKIAGSGMAFAPGQSVQLIDSVAGVPASIGVTNPLVRQGVAMLYTFDLALAGGALVATATSAQAAPEAKSLSEGRAGSHAFVNQGADLAVDKGMKSAYWAQFAPGTNWAAFAATGGGFSTYHTGSHVDVSGLSLIAGLAWKPNIEYGKFLLAPFFEAGWGGYNSYNSFSGADVGGKGNISYYGGGLLLRYELPIGLYFEASGRAGGVRTNYSSSDLRDVNNREAEYDMATAYYGAHAGLGYIWNFTEKASLDLYAKYLWSHQQGDTVRVAGDPIKFKDMDSHRLRFGARFSYAINDHISPYIGAAYEHEFDGRARASVYGHKIGTPDLVGGTGMGELGLTLKPSKNLPLSFDLGVQGYVGKREGVTGSLQIRYEF